MSKNKKKFGYKPQIITPGNIKCKVCKVTFIENRNAGYHFYKTCSIKCCMEAGYKPEDLENIAQKRAEQKLQPRNHRKEGRDGIAHRISYNSRPEKQPKRDFKRKFSNSNFYKTSAWRALRYNVLKTYGKKCMNCNDTKGVMHVDHIKPRAKFAQLELDFNNMQILCQDCNIGKGAWDYTDFRPTNISERRREINSPLMKLMFDTPLSTDVVLKTGE